MGVNWVSLAPDSVGWLFGPLDLPERRMATAKFQDWQGKCTSWGWGCQGVRVCVCVCVPGHLLLCSCAPVLQGPPLSGTCWTGAPDDVRIAQACGQIGEGGSIRMDGSHCQNSPEPPLTHPSGFLAWATDGWATNY